MKPGKLIGIAIIAGSIAATGYTLSTSMRPSLTVKEVMASPGEPSEVYGEVVKGTTHFDMTAAQLVFRLKDLRGDAVDVVYHKAKPANFDQASHVRARGSYREGAFQADELILKCPSKYIAKPKAPTRLSFWDAITGLFRPKPEAAAGTAEGRKLYAALAKGA